MISSEWLRRYLFFDEGDTTHSSFLIRHTITAGFMIIIMSLA